jgi:hypothetical protein
MLMVHKNLVKVSFLNAPGCDHDDFKKEINFYVKKIKKLHRIEGDINDRMESCSNEHLFKNVLKMIDDKDEHEKMPVRKFFNNTFDTLINDAIFELLKKQTKSKSHQIRTMQGSIKYVAQFLQDPDHLPENEAD